MSETSSNQSQGQTAAAHRARNALADQDKRRSRRPLENAAIASNRTVRAGQSAARQPDLQLRDNANPANEEKESQNIDSLLAHYGITTVPKAVYEWGDFRYSNPEDAIAAAKRGSRT